MIKSSPVPIRELVDPRRMLAVDDLELVARRVVEGFFTVCTHVHTLDARDAPNRIF